MTIDKLKSNVEAYRKSLEEKSGEMCMFSETGPVSMGVIDAIVTAIGSQQQRIEALENRLAAK